jgi:O-antigen biosynthesis protein
MRPGHTIAFLLGVPRSGTTLLSLLLNQHKSIYCPPEPWLLLGLDALGQVPLKHVADPPLVAGALAEFLGDRRVPALHTAADAIYQQVLEKTGKLVFVDKTPRYYHCLGLVSSFLPAGKVILLLRNPLDVAASYRRTWNQNLPEMIRRKSNSPFLFDYVLGFNRLIAFAENHPVLTIHYEDLVSSTAAEMKRLFRYLGVSRQAVSTEIDPGVAEYANTSFGDKNIVSHTTVHRDSLNAYRNAFSRQELKILLGALGQNLFERLGYGSCYAELAQELKLSPQKQKSRKLLGLVEEYAARRQIECENPESLGLLEAQMHQMTHQIEMLEKHLDQARAGNQQLSEQLVQAQAQNTALDEQLQQAQARNNLLDQQILWLQNMGFRARLRSDLRYTLMYLKHKLYTFLWRRAAGSGAPPLPKITLVTPVFNGGEFIESTLRSVLSQGYPFLEYIIVDGASTDDTLEIIERVRADDTFPNKISRIISEPDQGMSDAIAKGFLTATGDVFGYLNADDLLEAGALQRVGEYFAAHPKVDVIYHEDAVLVDGWKYPNVRQPEGIGTVDLLNQHILFQDGVFFRRGAYEAGGGIRRDLRLAGDYDLWLRLSADCKLVRRPEHVSCFRVRAGQLSGDMEAYYREAAMARRDFLQRSSPLRKMMWSMQAMTRPLRKFLNRMNAENDRLFFPIDFANMPPPPVVVTGPEYGAARSPVDGKPAERLLFSTPDTRFGGRDIQYIYLDTRHGIAITYPPVAADRLDQLYRDNYSSPPEQIKQPRGPSPYRRFNRMRRWEKALLRVPVERVSRRYYDNWMDRTLAELKAVLKGAKLDLDRPLSFLDAGCLEGRFLDEVRDATPWNACGLEPNAQAVERCLEKGHQVWLGHAESALDIIPEKIHFDVIFLSQTIEHMNDPLLVLRRLRLLLAPGGVMVISTPNLDSREIDWFGPTWAHWHAPYHRHIFSRRGLFALVGQAGLNPVCLKTFSHSYWSTMSVALNRLGLGGSVSHEVHFDPEIPITAERSNFWHRMIWNRLGRGDYIFLAARDNCDD